MAGSSEVGMEEELQKKDMGPLIVRFPRQVPVVEPVKLEYEDDDAGTGAAESKPPRNMVQVYLLGGYLVARWAWARFQERQNRRDPNNRNNPKD